MSAAPPAAGAGFLRAPTLEAASRGPGGVVRLSGAAPADAIVRLVAPEGRATGVTADAQGRWTAELPPGDVPRLFALSAETAGRTLRGEGALAVLPPGAVAVALIARAGAPSAPAAGSAPGALRLSAVDFDAGGGLAAAGTAPAGAALRLLADGAAAGAGQADASGRFTLLGVGAPLAPGAHRVRVEAAASAAEAVVDTAPAAPLSAAFRAARTAVGWRVDWARPGGGVQSLFAPDAPR